MLRTLTTHTYTHAHTHTQRKKKKERNLLEVMDKFLNLIVVVASWEYAYIQTHRNVCTKYVKILFTKYTSIQLTKEKK